MIGFRKVPTWSTRPRARGKPFWSMLPVNRYQRHESVTPAILPAERILDPEGAFVESTQAQGAEVDVPLTVVDLDQAEYSSSRVWRTLTHCLCQRIPPLRLTRPTS